MAKKNNNDNNFAPYITSNMKIVALRGDSNSGKTTSLNMLYAELLNRGAKPINPQHALPGKNDFECVVEYGGKKIAIFSLGDFIFALGLAMGYYSALEVDTLVIADSNKKYVKNPLFKSRQFDSNYIVIPKVKGGKNPAQQQAADQKAVQDILVALP
jgi:GTPase SAR1 family protein